MHTQKQNKFINAKRTQRSCNTPDKLKSTLVRNKLTWEESEQEKDLRNVQMPRERERELNIACEKWTTETKYYGMQDICKCGTFSL